MQVSIEDFKTGWYGVQIGISESEIPLLINRLKTLQETQGHFHFRSNYEGKGGVGDIEIYWVEKQTPKNMAIE
jgi:hypothetical protein